MNTLDCIMSRRSVRRYTGEEVTDAEIREILEAAGNAPSAGNQQPWHFIAVKDRSSLKKMSEELTYGKMLTEADCAIVVCMNTIEGVYPQFAVQDCAAATQNILLSAHDKGLGAVWLGVHPISDREKALCVLFNVPDGITVFSVVSMGRAPAIGERKVRLQERMVHRGKW